MAEFLCFVFLVWKPRNSADVTRDNELNLVFFPQPGDGVVFMAQTLERIYQEKLTLLPKPECEVKGRKMSEGISQHPCMKCQVKLPFKGPTKPL